MRGPRGKAGDECETSQVSLVEELDEPRFSVRLKNQTGRRNPQAKAPTASRAGKLF
jgi:hypothetical protein